MTKFYVKDERKDETDFHQVTRKLYKKIIIISDRRGALLRVGTVYHGGTPIKLLTLLRRLGHA